MASIKNGIKLFEKYLLQEKIIRIIKIKIKDTVKENKENGFNFCFNVDNIIVDRQHKKGDKNKVELDDENEPGYIIVGTFHTHVNRMADSLSTYDIKNFYLYPDRFACVATMHITSDKMICYLLKEKYKESFQIIKRDIEIMCNEEDKLNDELKELKLKRSNIEEEKYGIKAKKLNKQKYQIIDKYFIKNIIQLYDENYEIFK